MVRRPAEQAYRGLLQFDCPNPKCFAPQGEYCINPVSRKPAKIPCLERIKLGEQPGEQVTFDGEEAL